MSPRFPAAVGVMVFWAAYSSGCEDGNGGVGAAEEPSILFTEGFEDENFASRGWYDNTTLTTTSDEASSGNSSLEVQFAAGATTPSYGGGTRHLFPETRSVYLSYWVKYSASWVGSGQAFHPHEFHFVTNADDRWVGPAFTNLTTYVEHNYQNGGIPVLSIQDGKNIDTSRVGEDLTSITEDRAVAGCNGDTDGYGTDCYAIGNGLYNNGKSWKASRPYFLPTPGPDYKNDWHLVEAYFALNSIENGIGVPNGVVRYWFDGELVIDHADVVMRTAAHPDMMFNQFLIAFYIGSGSPVDQTAWIDDLTVAAGR